MVMSKNRISLTIRLLIQPLLLLCVGTLVCGCSATQTVISKRNLETQTKMSSTIFLDPVQANKKTVFVQLRNTSDKQELNLEPYIIEALAQKGYCLVQNPDQAHYLLQANILQVGKSDLRAAESALSRGFGAALGGAAVGTVVGSTVDGSSNSNGEHGQETLAMGVLTGAEVSTVTNTMVEDVVYFVVADVQISERVGNSVVVKEKTRSKLKQGTSGHKEITSTVQIAWNRYQTRIVSTANKVNLKFSKAAPYLIQGLTHSISGIF